MSLLVAPDIHTHPYFYDDNMSIHSMIHRPSSSQLSACLPCMPASEHALSRVSALPFVPGGNPLPRDPYPASLIPYFSVGSCKTQPRGRTGCRGLGNGLNCWLWLVWLWVVWARLGREVCVMVLVFRVGFWFGMSASLDLCRGSLFWLSSVLEGCSGEWIRQGMG